MQPYESHALRFALLAQRTCPISLRRTRLTTTPRRSAASRTRWRCWRPRGRTRPGRRTRTRRWTLRCGLPCGTQTDRQAPGLLGCFWLPVCRFHQEMQGHGSDARVPAQIKNTDPIPTRWPADARLRGGGVGGCARVHVPLCAPRAPAVAAAAGARDGEGRAASGAEQGAGLIRSLLLVAERHDGRCGLLRTCLL